MQHINQLMTDGLSTTKTQAGSTNSTNPTRADAELVNKIFRRLKVKCTAWKQAVEGDVNLWAKDYKRELLDALIRHQVSDWRMVDRGLSSVTTPWLPNQDQFAEWCKLTHADFGMPDPVEAYVEACSQYSVPTFKRKWSHPAVYAAAAKTGSMFLRSHTEKTALPTFKRNYQEFVEKVMAGEKLEIPESERLEKKPDRPLSKKENLSRLDGLKNLFD